MIDYRKVESGNCARNKNLFSLFDKHNKVADGYCAYAVHEPRAEAAYNRKHKIDALKILREDNEIFEYREARDNGNRKERNADGKIHRAEKQTADSRRKLNRGNDKETDNPEEAITDLSVMNMTGKFSYSDYKQIMKQNREKIKETIDGFAPVIAEFQSNYEAENPKALAAYESLNVFKDDDSGKLMGDYLLEYDFSEDAEKKMTDTFMQANAKYILTIMELTSFAGDDSDDTMIDRVTQIGPDGIQKKYSKAYPTVAKANQDMAAEYGETAMAILNDWNSVYNYILDAEKELVKPAELEDDEPVFTIDFEESTEINVADYKNLDADEKELLESINDLTDNLETTTDIIDCELYDMLFSTEYGDGTMLDFFKRPASEVKKEELYPFVDAMSEGQRSQVEMNGLKTTLISAFTELEAGTEESENAVKEVEEIAGSFDAVSIFEGVDRSAFEEGVAFTSAATEHENLTGES